MEDYSLRIFDGVHAQSPAKTLHSSWLQLLIVLSLQSGIDAIFPFLSNISLGSSYSWYLRMTQFETVMFGLFMLQITVLRWLEILPININNLFSDPPDPTGRKKRHVMSSSNVCEDDSLTEAIFKLMRKLDDEDCISRSLCVLQQESQFDHRLSLKLPRETSALLSALYQYNAKAVITSNNSTCKGLERLQYYQDAVRLGAKAEYANSTLCENRYRYCGMSRDDVIHYVGILIDADML